MTSRATGAFSPKPWASPATKVTVWHRSGAASDWNRVCRQIKPVGFCPAKASHLLVGPWRPFGHRLAATRAQLIVSAGRRDITESNPHARSVQRSCDSPARSSRRRLIATESADLFVSASLFEGYCMVLPVPGAGACRSCLWPAAAATAGRSGGTHVEAGNVGELTIALRRALTGKSYVTASRTRREAGRALPTWHETAAHRGRDPRAVAMTGRPGGLTRGG